MTQISSDPAELTADELPILVAAVDAEDMPDSIPAARADGTLYRGAWLLVRAGGDPIGILKLPFTTDAIARETLQPEIARMTQAAPASDRPPAPEDPPRISVVVCSTFARRSELEESLTSIVAVDYSNFEVIVVDNRVSGADGDVDWIHDLGEITVVRELQPGLSASRNRGLAAAGGSIIAFTDDDVVVDPGWLDALARRFADRPDEVAVAGLIMPKDLESPAQSAFESYYGGLSPQVMQRTSHRLDGARRSLFSKATILERTYDGRIVSEFTVYNVGRFGAGANMAFRADRLRAAGGFKIALGAGTPARGGEDIAMFARLAWQGDAIGFEPSALVFHRHRTDARGLTGQIEDYGIGFVATLLALIAEDPRHLGALVASLSLGVRLMVRNFWNRIQHREETPLAGTDSSSQAALARREMRGMAKGPAAYVRSLRRARALQAIGRDGIDRSRART